MKNIFNSIVTDLQEAANHCPSGTGGHDKIWLKDAKKIVQRYLPLTKYYFQPPCKIGDTLYDISDFLDDRESPEIIELHCKEITLLSFEDDVPLWCIDSTNIYPSDIGTRIFYSEDAAKRRIEQLLQPSPAITR